jgi:hypothetical protein
VVWSSTLQSVAITPGVPVKKKARVMPTSSSPALSSPIWVSQALSTTRSAWRSFRTSSRLPLFSQQARDAFIFQRSIGQTAVCSAQLFAFCFPARPATRCVILSLVSSRRASLPTQRAVRESDVWRRWEVAMATAFSSVLRWPIARIAQGKTES